MIRARGPRSNQRRIGAGTADGPRSGLEPRSLRCPCEMPVRDKSNRTVTFRLASSCLAARGDLQGPAAGHGSCCATPRSRRVREARLCHRGMRAMGVQVELHRVTSEAAPGCGLGARGRPGIEIFCDPHGVDRPARRTSAGASTRRSSGAFRARPAPPRARVPTATSRPPMRSTSAARRGARPLPRTAGDGP